MKRLYLAGLVAALLQGCALFSTPPSKPIIEDRVGSEDASDNDKRVGTLATVAQRRLVLIRFNTGMYCAEPPPDAVDNVSATLSAALSADLQATASEQGLGARAQIATALATVARQLFYRSQGLQLYRDGMFSLCNAYVNGTIDKAGFIRKHGDLLRSTQQLIAQEIPLIKDIRQDNTGAVTAPTPATLTHPPPPTAPAKP